MTGRTGFLAKVRSGAILLAALAWSGPAAAQSDNGISNFLGNIFSGQKSATSAPAQAAPGGSGAALPWSGEDGASGHPLMTASAIREAAANFDRCVASMWLSLI